MSVENWIEDILQTALVFLTPGFIFGTNGQRYIRISLCCEESIIDLAIKRIQTFLKNRDLKQKAIL